MSLEAILDQIRADGHAQIQQILQQAECEAQAILEQARQEAGGIYQAAYQTALQPSAGECARVLNQARFEARCLLGEVREDYITTVMKRLYQRLEQARASTDYVEAMRCYLVEVLPRGNGQVPLSERVLLQADPRDKNLFEGLLREDSQGIDIDYVLQCWGGLIAVSNDGTTRMINTLETRLESAAPFLRKELANRFERQIATAAPIWEYTPHQD